MRLLQFTANIGLTRIGNFSESAEKVKAGSIPNVPILMFCSDGSGGTGFSKEDWQKIQTDFSNSNNADIIYLDCGHYVHDYEYVKIAKDIKSFLK